MVRRQQMKAYQLTRERVRDVVPAGQPGFYRLGHVINNKFHTVYVGRSDSCLRTRLCKHPKIEWYDHFRARTVATVEQAFELECLHYHLEGDNVSNRIHPAQPDDSNVSCPYCQFERSIAELKAENNKIYKNNVA